jgi:nucleoside-diphosphate-sugar epimerase
MRIAILGATSQIAKDLILSFAKKNLHELILFARKPDSVKSWVEKNPLVKKYQIKDLKNFNTDERFDAILNFIGVGSPIQATIIGTDILNITQKFDNLVIEYLQRRPECRYIFASSGAVYGINFSSPVEENSHSIIPVNSFKTSDYYSLAKIYAEYRHRSLVDLPIVDIRIFSYFSSTSNMNSGFLITDILKSIIENKIFTTSDINIVRDYASPKEIYKLIESILMSAPINIGVDCFSQAPIDKFEILELMRGEYKLEYKINIEKKEIPNSLNKLNYYSINKKATEIFGYIPEAMSSENIKNQTKILLNQFQL